MSWMEIPLVIRIGNRVGKAWGAKVLIVDGRRLEKARGWEGGSEIYLWAMEICLSLACGLCGVLA